MRRVLVTGNSGSGKSTVARALGQILDLPVVHLDRLFWNPGWVESDEEDFKRRVDEALAADAWVCDGNYSRYMGDRIERADTLVFLDLPRRLCHWRVFRRAGSVRPDMPPGCVERRWSRDHWAFHRDWIRTYPTRSRPKMLALVAEHWDTKTVAHLRSPASVDRFLDGLRRSRTLPR